jgi:hypothetical protein
MRSLPTLTGSGSPRLLTRINTAAESEPILCALSPDGFRITISIGVSAVWTL